jgi:Leucine-rich repeat (LRR) protein
MYPNVQHGKLLNISNKNLNSLKDYNFGEHEITSLDCSFNNLKTLKGCPEGVEFLRCNNNQLKTLEGCPKSVRTLYVHRNALESLEFIPENLEILCVYDNKLTSMEHLPKTVISATFGFNKLPKWYLDNYPDNGEYEYAALNNLHNYLQNPQRKSKYWLRSN